MSDISPIGVFDSGLGGLTVAKKLLDQLPHESMTFVGDEIHIPYGERSPRQITELALGICDYLIGRNTKLIIMACNMSSAVALSAAREAFPSTPILGVIEAGVRALIKTNPAGSVGVLATSGTVKASAYTRTIRSAAPDIEVYEQACPLFVPLVEEGIWDTTEAVNVAREYAAPLYERGCRTFILGCTHYPYLADTIRRAVGEDITLIDPAEETAQEAANILLTTGRLNPDHVEPLYTFLTSADTDRFAELGGKFLGRKIDAVERINWGIDLRKIECQEKTVDKMVKSAL